MHARLTWIKGAPEGVQSRRRHFEETALPLMREQPGFQGVVVVGNSDTGDGMVVSYWESEEAMEGAMAALAPTRERVFAEQGLEPVLIEQYEVIGVERIAPSKVGPSCRVLTGTGLTGDNATSLWEEGKALAGSQPGFCSLRYCLNRENGNFLIGSSWESDEDRDASMAPLAGLRARMTDELGVTGLEVNNYELWLAEVPATASATT